MDSSVSDQNLITRWFSKSSVRLLTLASVIVAILAVLHVSQQQASAPMQELLQGSNLQTRDLQRMQIAFGQAGLNEFEIKDGVVWVPQAKHSAYLAAAAEHQAIPAELKVTEGALASDTGNPFLSRSQQEYRQHLRRKTQIQEMVIRLPFVEQAWCEMDQAPRQNAFSKVRRSAVLSIRSNPDCQLRVAHVDTIKQMVAGAVADLAVENIVVIDLNSGFAHLDNIDQLTQKQRELHQISANQKRFYESRAQELLRDYPGVKIRVDVAVKEVVVEAAPTVISTFVPVQQVASPVAGANGVVSIEVEAPEQSNIAPVGNEVETTVQLDKQLHVFVDIPTESVFAALGEPIDNRKNITDKARQASIDQQTRTKFERFKRTIADRLLPLFPNEQGKGSRLAEQGNSLDFRLLPAVARVKAASNWQTRAQAWLGANWPSIGVLGIGAVLLTLVFRRSEHFRPAVSGQVTETGYTTGTQSDLSAHNENEIQNDPDSEVQLTKLIQEDPDSAAKIIETWIRDAA